MGLKSDQSWGCPYFIITINVPVVFMAQYVMVLRDGTLLQGALEGGAPKIETFLGPEMAQAKRVPFGPKKVEIFKAHPFQCPEY